MDKQPDNGWPVVLMALLDDNNGCMVNVSDNENGGRA